MQVKPVKEYKSPSYPAREAVFANPVLLKTLPRRWRENAYVAIAISSLFIMTLTACSNNKGNGASTGSNNGGQAAPLFIHGDGRGTFGCESVAPPAFLSEEEAFSVIAEEAKREGIILKKESPTLNNIRLPETQTYYDPDKKESMRSRKGSLQLDGFDESKKIGFEFVSKDDIYSWEHNDSGFASSVENFEFLESARILNNGIKGKSKDMTVAVFYDPNYKYDSEEVQALIKDNKDDYKDMEIKLKDLVKSDLREQVRDFLYWLKGQGII